MSRTRIQKIGSPLLLRQKKLCNLPKNKSTDTSKFLKQSLQVITCECGTDILIVPDLQAMNHAIKAHVKEHRKKEDPLKRTMEPSSNINELLLKLLLKKISNQNVTHA
jgi:hypothetical protein